VTTRILLLEDHTLVRSGIRSLLERSSEMRVVGECGDGRTALQLCGELAPDIVLADVEMRDLNGIETARQIRAQHEQIKVIMLSMHGDRQYVLEALRAGASGYVLKDAAVEELLAAIRSVVGGRRYLSPLLADLVMEDYVQRAAGRDLSSDLDKLSVREREILQLVAEGNSSAAIAAQLHISVRTADTHRFSVMKKLGIHSIAGLTKFAIMHGVTSVK
jgi:DNA-binding NarL/FixJ family response regulator